MPKTGTEMVATDFPEKGFKKMRAKTSRQGKAALFTIIAVDRRKFCIYSVYTSNIDQATFPIDADKSHFDALRGE